MTDIAKNAHLVIVMTPTSDTMKETKFLVFFSSLMELLAAWFKCLSPCTLSTMMIGTSLSVKQHCTSCEHLRTWIRQLYIGNGALPAVIYFLQPPFCMLEQLQHKFYVYWSSYVFQLSHRHQSHYHMPSMSRVWEKESTALIAVAWNRSLPLNLVGDGRANSPGHGVKFGTYSIIDLDQNKVIDVQLVQVNDVDCEWLHIKYYEEWLFVIVAV